MLAKLKYRCAVAAMVCIGTGSITRTATAVTAEVAKNCDALTAKAFPPLVPGNPAAGSANGTAQEQQSYFSKCLENGGKMDEPRPAELPNPVRGPSEPNPGETPNPIGAPPTRN